MKAFARGFTTSRRVAGVLSAAALAIVVACSSGAEPSGPIVDLASARAAWAGAGVDDYRFDFDRQCFCLPAAVEPVTIEVRDGRVASVISRRTGQPVESGENISWYTIEELFGLIEAAEAGGTTVRVEYADSGHPTLITIVDLAADAGVEYRIGNVTPL